MSRSYRKTPIIGCCWSNVISEKEDKRQWHRRYRRKCKAKIHHEWTDLELLPDYREVSETWTMNKEGKCWFGHLKYAAKDGCLAWRGEHRLYHAIDAQCPCQIDWNTRWEATGYQRYLEMMRK